MTQSSTPNSDCLKLLDANQLAAQFDLLDKPERDNARAAIRRHCDDANTRITELEEEILGMEEELEEADCDYVERAAREQWHLDRAADGTFIILHGEAEMPVDKVQHLLNCMAMGVQP